MLEIVIDTGDDPWPAVQAIGGLIGLGIAIIVPAALDILRRCAERRELVSKRRAAWRAMTEVCRSLDRRKLVRPGEIEAVGSVLDHLDLSVFPEEAMSVLVILRTEVAMAGADATLRSGAGKAVTNGFNAKTMLNNQKTIRKCMGIGDEPVPGARRPLTVPFFAGDFL